MLFILPLLAIVLFGGKNKKNKPKSNSVVVFRSAPPNGGSTKGNDTGQGSWCSPKNPASGSMYAYTQNGDCVEYWNSGSEDYLARLMEEEVAILGPEGACLPFRVAGKPVDNPFKQTSKGDGGFVISVPNPRMVSAAKYAIGKAYPGFPLDLFPLADSDSRANISQSDIAIWNRTIRLYVKRVCKIQVVT